MMKNVLLIACLLSSTYYLMGQESLKIVWLEQYEWKLLSNNEDGRVHVIEIIPGKETAENWTMLGQMMSIKGVAALPMDQAKDLMFEQARATAPDAQLTEVERDEATEHPWILFKIENPQLAEQEGTESQLWYIRQGKPALYVNFIARKEAQLADEFVAEWSAVFKASEVVVLGEDGVEEGKD